ncbi:MAG TPA: glycosyltransferase family 4 protein [Actinomycetes bacterium]
MDDKTYRSLLLVPTWAGQESCAALERMAAVGAAPRTDYVELARALGAEIIDMRFMTERATRTARMVARCTGISLGQVVEGFLRRDRCGHLVVKADRLGLPLALLFKLTRSRRDMVLISAWLSPPKNAVFLWPLKAHSHIGEITSSSSVQLEVAASRLGVPREKLHHALQPVDERFWHPVDEPVENMICSVGSERRDYPTLLEALQGLRVRAELAVGSTVLRPAGDPSAEFAVTSRQTAGGALSPNVRVRQQVNAQDLRRLYARSRFVVIPLLDGDVDVGVTSICEAMAMGKAVVVTRTRGQVDVIRDGEQGIYVPPGDPRALRAALEYLLSHPAEAERMGRVGRALIEARHRLDTWVALVAGLARGPDRPRATRASA